MRGINARRGLMAQPGNSMTQADINRTAAAYFAAMESGDMTQDDERELSVWLAQDRRHIMAFDRAATIWSSLDAVPLHAPVRNTCHTLVDSRGCVEPSIQRSADPADALTLGTRCSAVGPVMPFARS
ncbi:DUF4880 domain-containing protein [Sphingobium yanoikuyae]|uniref:FecR/PupR family sigma factor regulator n=1 Tax=Sphingobium yanoikuyae TaxID=13690 RepID=A0A430BBL7_SPHYA|nr:DUF4880 domain-containing protein [Sphingobium yanoikuyae]RSU45941.1 FecR/PupR family sigma factor regulator [Sphingobium yanoikuyae]